jgi:deazaflavin-dependent oxidoreductase (nitroreductase family)
VRPGRVLKWLLRAPVALYSVRVGWLLGHRFLLLRHRGRRSHRLYSTVLEVVAWRRAIREAVVMSGFGPRSQWYRNLLAGQAVEVQIGRLRFAPSVRTLSTDEAVGVLADYERRNRLAVPLVRAVLSKLAGFRYDGSDAAQRRWSTRFPLWHFARATEKSYEQHRRLNAQPARPMRRYGTQAKHPECSAPSCRCCCGRWETFLEHPQGRPCGPAATRRSPGRRPHPPAGRRAEQSQGCRVANPVCGFW